VSCRDCHESHSLSLRAEGNNLCLTCHEENFYGGFEHSHHQPESEGSQCVDCHMPASTYMVVDPRRDHSIRIPRPDLTARFGIPNACNGCHTDQTPSWSIVEIQKWKGLDYKPVPHYGEALHTGRSGAPGWPEALLGLAKDPEQPAIARASALDLIADRGMILPAAELSGFLADPNPLLRMAALRSAENLPAAVRPEVALPLLEDSRRVVRGEAARLLAPVSDQLDADQRSAFDAALEDYLDYQGLNSDRPWAHVNLGILHASRGDLPTARAAYERALRLDPKAINARVNLADLYRQLGDAGACERVLLEGLTLVPDSAELEHSRGLLLVRNAEPNAAMLPLARAAELRPENPRFSYVYAVALHSSDPAAAIQVLEKAQERHPWDEELLFGLAAFERDRGNLAEAIRWAERLVQTSQQPGAQNFLAELQAQSKR